MKKFIFSLMFSFSLLFPVNTFAAPDCGTNPELCNCVVVIFNRPAQANLVVIKPWSKVAELGQRQYRHSGNRRFNWLAMGIYYAQFGVQGGPTAYTPTADGEELLLSYLPPTAGEAHPMFIVNWWRKAMSANSDQGQGGIFMGAIDATEDVGLKFETTTGRTAHKHASGTGEFFSGGSNQTNIDAAEVQLLRQTEDDVWDELLENGCP